MRMAPGTRWRTISPATRRDLCIISMLIFAILAGCGWPSAPAVQQPELADPAVTPTNDGSQADATGGATTNADPSATSKTIQKMNPIEISAALADPQRAEEGIWAMLSALGVGVYTGDGRQILAGSETHPEDFWLYDFEVPLLVEMALEAGLPFSMLHKRLSEIGLEENLEGTLKIYQDVYAEHPQAFLVKLFEAMDLKFEADPEITPLQEWLLLLDSFVPPNGLRTGASRQLRGQVAAAFLSQGSFIPGGNITGKPWLSAEQPCGWIVGGNIQPNWGLVQANPQALEVLVAMEQAYIAIHGPLLAKSLQASLRGQKDVVHEAHGDAAPDTAEFTVSIAFKPPPEASAPFLLGAPICGPLVDLDPPREGPIPNAKVYWFIDSVFQEHGQFKDYLGIRLSSGGQTMTDHSGKTSIIYEVRKEPAGGEGEIVSTRTSLEARIVAQEALTLVGIRDPRLLLFVPEFITVRPRADIQIEWHNSPVVGVFLVEHIIQLASGDGDDYVEYYGEVLVPLTFTAEGLFSGEAPMKMVATIKLDLYSGETWLICEASGEETINYKVEGSVDADTSEATFVIVSSYGGFSLQGLCTGDAVIYPFETWRPGASVPWDPFNLPLHAGASREVLNIDTTETRIIFTVTLVGTEMNP